MEGSNSKLQGPRTLEERLIEQILVAVKPVRPALYEVKTVVLLQNGTNSETFKYVNERVQLTLDWLDQACELFERFDDLIGQSSIVGVLSPHEKRRRLIFLIRLVGIEEVLKIIEQIQNNEVPENVTYLPYHQAKRVKQKILGLNKKPKGNGAA